MSLTNVNGTVCEDYNVNRPLTASNVGFQSLNLSNTTNQLTIGAAAHLSTISVIAPAAATQLYTLPDVAANANFVMTAGNQTLGGVKSFSSGIPISQTTNQLVLGSASHNAIISSTAPAAASQTYTLYDAGNSCNVRLGLDNVTTFSPTVTPQTLTIAQSGMICFLPQATASIVINLPAPTAGWNVKVILTAVADGTHTVTFSAPSAVMSGTRYGVIAAPVGVSATNVTNLILSATAANAVVGDNITFMSDGTKIYYTAWSNGTGAAFSTS